MLEQEGLVSAFNLASNPASQSCRLIDFDKATVRPGILPNTFFLTVEGTKPCVNMRVDLIPLVYVTCPDFWGIEVVGCLPDGICLTQTAPYQVTIPLAGITGSAGIEVIGANKQEKIKVSGGCQSAAES